MFVFFSLLIPWSFDMLLKRSQESLAWILSFLRDRSLPLQPQGSFHLQILQTWAHQPRKIFFWKVDQLQTHVLVHRGEKIILKSVQSSFTREGYIFKVTIGGRVCFELIWRVFNLGFYEILISSSFFHYLLLDLFTLPFVIVVIRFACILSCSACMLCHSACLGLHSFRCDNCWRNSVLTPHVFGSWAPDCNAQNLYFSCVKGYRPHTSANVCAVIWVVIEKVQCYHPSVTMAAWAMW